MRSLRRHRPATAKRHPRTLPSLAVAVGVGIGLGSSLLVPASAGGAAAGPGSADRYIYVTNQLDNTLSVIDGSNYTVVATVPVGTSPEGVAVSPDGKYAYIAEGGDNAVSVFNTATNTIASTVALPAGSSPS